MADISARLPATLVRRRVLVCLVPRGIHWHIPLTLRPAHMVDHAGQISLPGGTSEEGETLRQCALREYGEELGADESKLTVLGQLSPLYVFASNFFVTPWMAVVDAAPCWHPNPHEVQRVLELPLLTLLDPGQHAVHLLHRRGYHFASRHIQCGEDRIWGATGMILMEVAQVVRDGSIQRRCLRTKHWTYGNREGASIEVSLRPCHAWTFTWVGYTDPNVSIWRPSPPGICFAESPLPWYALVFWERPDIRPWSWSRFCFVTRMRRL